jgi:hypothetical protein
LIKNLNIEVQNKEFILKIIDMSILTKPGKVKLVIAFFSTSAKILDEIESKFKKKYGKIDYKTPDIDFIETDYYNEEMGENLKTRYISFEKIVLRSSLPLIKKYCCKLENKYSKTKDSILKRLVNIDPGLLSLENFILATGKAYSHRIYLDKGVWADLTLIYQKDNYINLPWTYPNYQSKKIKKALIEIREIYHKQLKNKK